MNRIFTAMALVFGLGMGSLQAEASYCRDHVAPYSNISLHRGQILTSPRRQKVPKFCRPLYVHSLSFDAFSTTPWNEGTYLEIYVNHTLKGSFRVSTETSRFFVDVNEIAYTMNLVVRHADADVLADPAVTLEKLRGVVSEVSALQ